MARAQQGEACPMEANRQVMANNSYMCHKRRVEISSSIIRVTREQDQKVQSISTSIQPTRLSPITSIKRQTLSTLTCDRSSIQRITQHMDKHSAEETMWLLPLTQMLHRGHSIRNQVDSASIQQAYLLTKIPTAKKAFRLCP